MNDDLVVALCLVGAAIGLLGLFGILAYMVF